MDSGFISNGGCDIYYESHGSGTPVLYLHAGVADSRMWGGQHHLDGYRCVVFDQRGFGRTPVVAEPYTDKGDVIAVLDGLELTSAVVVGCSIGAGTAMQLAIEDPERVEKLVLVGGYPSGWIPERGFEDNPLEEEAEQASEAGDLDRVLELDYLMWLVGYGRDESAIDENLKELFMDMDRVAVSSQRERDANLQHRQYKLDDRLGEISAPTLVIVGAHDEAAMIEASEYLAYKLSDRDPVIIDDAAHLPPLEQPEAFNRELMALLGS